MTPIGYTVKNGTTTFLYKFSEMRKFILDGRNEGNNGMVISRRYGKLLEYRGYGMIEAPIKTPMTFTVVWNEKFSGKMPTDDDFLIPPKSMLDNLEPAILDFGSGKSNPYPENHLNMMFEKQL